MQIFREKNKPPSNLLPLLKQGCLRSSVARSGGGAFRSRSASRCAPSGPRPFPPLSRMWLMPLAPTPLTTRTSPLELTWPTCGAQGIGNLRACGARRGETRTRIVDRCTREEIGARDLELGGAGQEGRHHRPGPAPQVLSPAQP